MGRRKGNETSVVSASSQIVERNFICINCKNTIRELYKKISNTPKTVRCEKCHNVADKYIEFEPIIILIDALLLSQLVFRHLIYNANFKLYWKLSLVLLLLESFALYRQKRDEARAEYQPDSLHEKGFYICSIQNIVDYMIIMVFLLLIKVTLEPEAVFRKGLKSYLLIVLKAVAVSNLSKILIFPILVWRDNIIDSGYGAHYILVLGHHLFSLVLVYDAISINSRNILASATIVLPTFLFKEFLKRIVSTYIENNL